MTELETRSLRRVRDLKIYPRVEIVVTGHRAIELATPLRHDGYHVATVYSGSEKKMFDKAKRIRPHVIMDSNGRVFERNFSKYYEKAANPRDIIMYSYSDESGYIGYD